MKDRPNILLDALTVFKNNNINMTNISSRPPKTCDASGDKLINFNIDFHGNFGDPNVDAAMSALEKMAHGLTKVGSTAVPWFPTDINDFDHIGKRTLGEGDGI